MKWLVLVFGLLPAIVFLSRHGSEQVRAGQECCCCCLTYKCLPRLTACQLEQLYAQADVGRFPVGFMRGRLLVMTDFPFPKASVVLSGLAWKGKHVGPDGTFINQFTGVRAIGSKAFIGPSWYDGRPAIVMQYPPNTALFGNIRDEFREIAPGLYLGQIYQRCPCPRFLGFMCLEIVPCKCARPYK
jgi:hypothetical protein